jgi:nitroimidazol reductase NimA-like FMN-containing flavoprotein (pyridoxamine 5'-phosphate oxidase superfamily)
MKKTLPTSPLASRPDMPGYGIQDEHSGRGLLPWSWAEERLARARNYWVATTRPDGRPHAMPVWGVWLNNTFYFSSGRQSRKARNLAANPNCVICPEAADEAVIMEGVAAEVTDAAELSQFAAVYAAKYQWEGDPAENPVYAVQPQVVFGLIEAAEEFSGSATRWLFADF